MKNGYLSPTLSYGQPRSAPRAQRGRSAPRLLATVAVVAVLGLGGWWWMQHRSAAKTGADAAVAPGAGAGASSRRFGATSKSQPVSVGLVKQRDMRILISAIGNMTALNNAIVQAKVSGEVKAIHFQEGDMVRAGQPLVDIEDLTYKAAVLQMQGQLLRDQAQLRNARVDLKRYQDLLAQDSIQSQQVDTQVELVKQLEGTVKLDEGQLDNAKVQLSYTRVTAPISGRTGLKQTDLGSIASTTATNGLVTITQTQPIALVFAVPEENTVEIRRRLKEKHALLVEAWDREQKHKLAEGQVYATDNSIDMTTGTIKLKALFPNKDDSLFPNQFVNVRLQLGVLKDQLAVPTTAIQRGSIGTYVYVVGDDNSVKQVRVRTGVTEGDWVSISGEIQTGQKVVTDGADRLRDGAKVEVIAAAARDSHSDSHTGHAAAVAAGASAASMPEGAGAGAGAKPASAPQAAAAGDALPPWFDKLPPETQERFKKKNPDERREFIEKARERRQQRQGSDS